MRRRHRQPHHRLRHRPGRHRRDLPRGGKAIKALLAKEVTRIILTRPAIKAGKRLGFLPGTLHEKIDRTCAAVDALHDILDPDSMRG